MDEDNSESIQRWNQENPEQCIQGQGIWRASKTTRLHRFHTTLKGVWNDGRFLGVGPNLVKIAVLDQI